MEIRDILKKATHVKSLKFDGCDLGNHQPVEKTGSRVSWILKILESCSWIEAVNFNGNPKIENDPSFPQLLQLLFAPAKGDEKEDFQSKRVKAVNFANCSLSDSTVGQILDYFEKCCNRVQVLDLSENALKDQFASNFRRILEKNKYLNSLLICCNQMTDESAKEISSALKTNTTLLCIGLGGNKIGVQGAKYLADALKENKTLASLHLVENEFGDEGASAIFDSLHQNRSLKILNMGFNNLSIQSAFSFAKALQRNNVLQNIYLTENAIFLDGTKEIVKVLRNNFSLKICDLSFNPGYNRQIEAATKVNKDLCIIEANDEKMIRKHMQFWDSLGTSTIEMLDKESDEVYDLLFTMHYATKAHYIKPIRYSSIPGAQELFHFLSAHHNFELEKLEIEEVLASCIYGRENIKQHILKTFAGRSKTESPEYKWAPTTIGIFGAPKSGKRAIADCISLLLTPTEIYFDYEDIEGMVSSIPQITNDAQVQIMKLFVSIGVITLEDIGTKLDPSQVETSDIPIRFKKKLLLEISKIQLKYDSPLKKNQLFLDLSSEFGDRQIYTASLFNRIKINPLTVIIVRWTPGKNNLVLNDLVGRFRSGKIILEDFSEVDTTKSTLIICSSMFQDANSSKVVNGKQFCASAQQTLQQRCLNAAEFSVSFANFSNETKELNSIENCYRVSQLSLSGKAFLVHKTLLKLQKEIFAKSSRSKILSWNLDICKVIAKIAFFSEVSDQVCIRILEDFVNTESEKLSGPFLKLEVNVSFEDEMKFDESLYSLCNDGVGDFSRLVGSMSRICKEAIKIILPSFRHDYDTMIKK